MLQIEIWSDVVCPWCYIGKRRMERALAELNTEASITWRSFELDPNAPSSHSTPLTELLATKYGISPARASQMQAQVTQTAREDGLTFRLDLAKSGNSFHAHRLIKLAHAHHLGDAMKERLMLAYFTQGLPISEPDTLAQLAQEVGLDAEEVARVLRSDAYADAVREDERAARKLGVRGVPFFVINESLGVSGAQPVEVLCEALRSAMQRDAAQAPAAAADGPICDDEQCEV